MQLEMKKKSELGRVRMKKERMNDRKKGKKKKKEKETKKEKRNKGR
jgi:hypothetical protein